MVRMTIDLYPIPRAADPNRVRHTIAFHFCVLGMPVCLPVFLLECFSFGRIHAFCPPKPFIFVHFMLHQDFLFPQRMNALIYFSFSFFLNSFLWLAFSCEWLCMFPRTSVMIGFSFVKLNEKCMSTRPYVSPIVIHHIQENIFFSLHYVMEFLQNIAIQTVWILYASAVLNWCKWLWFVRIWVWFLGSLLLIDWQMCCECK